MMGRNVVHLKYYATKLVKFLQTFLLAFPVYNTNTAMRPLLHITHSCNILWNSQHLRNQL